MRCAAALSRRKVELADLEKEAIQLGGEAESLVSCFKSKRVSEEEYLSRRAALEKEFAEIMDRVTRLRFVEDHRSRSEKT